MRLGAVAFSLLCISFFACGSSSDGSSVANGTTDGGGDDAGQAGNDAGTVADSGGGTSSSIPPGDSIGTATGSIRLLVRVQWTTVPTAKGLVDVTVMDSTGNPLSDATVVVTPEGGADATATPGSAGVYDLPLTTWASSYDISVTHAQGTRTGIHLVTLPLHTVTFAATPAVGTALPITWTPNGDATLSDDVFSDATSSAADWDAEEQDSTYDKSDRGSYTIPAAAFPSSSTYYVGVLRAQTFTVTGALTVLVSVAITNQATL